MRILGRIWYTDIIVLRWMAKFISRQMIALLKTISEKLIQVNLCGASEASTVEEQLPTSANLRLSSNKISDRFCPIKT